MIWRTLVSILSAVLLLAILTAPAEAVITHRYSFTTNANDSVGSAHWTNNGGATFTGGQVNFDGVDDYLSLGSTPLPAAGSTTIEFWGTYATNTAVGSRAFDFASGTGAAYFYHTPRSTPLTPEGNPQDPAVNGSNTRWRWNDDGASYPDIGPMAASPANTNQEILFTLVFDSTASMSAGEFRMYQDGFLIATDAAEGLPILSSLAGTTSNRLGHGTSVPAGATVRDLPAFLTGSLNEFRIYNNPLTQLEVLTNLISGPDQTTVSFTDKTWNVATNDWNTGGNWAAPGVPAVGNRAVIGNGGTANVTATVPQAGNVRITNGTLAVGAGGSLNSKYPIEMTTGDANTATINVTGGGVLAVGGIVPDAGLGAKTINIDGGTIRPGFKTAIVLPGATTNIGAGGVTFDTAGTDAITWGSSLAGSGDITKTGTGTLVLRPPTAGLGLDDQNPNFTGEVFVNNGALDIQREHGVLGKAGSTQSGKVHLNNSTLIINTAYPINFRKEMPADVVVSGTSEIRNMVDRAATESRMEGSISGDGTLVFTKPVVADANGIDFQNHGDALATEPNGFIPVDNSGFTGRIVANGNFAIRFFATLYDPDAVPDTGDEVLYDDTDFPNAVVEMANAGAWMGKRGSSPNQTIRLGGVAGLAGSRLQAAIAGDGDLLADVTYRLGSDFQDAEFFGNVIDSTATATDNVTIVKVGSNTQTFAGLNEYSGTTTINGGTLRVNGTHQISATFPAPVGDYTVNTGGTLEGTGTIGVGSDPIDIIANGGTIAPGASVGTLSLVGNAVFGANSIFDIEVDGADADRLTVTGDIDLSALGNVLNVSGSGSGSWIIASYTGTRTGAFESIPAGLMVNYGTGTNSVITLSGTISAAGLPGDYNDDNVVDAADYTVWRNNFGTNFDLNGNGDESNGSGGTVDEADYVYWKMHYGTSGPGAGGLSTAVPEPASMVLLVLAASVFGIRRHRR